MAYPLMFEYGFNGLGMGVLFLYNTCRLLCVTNSAQNFAEQERQPKNLLRFAVYSSSWFPCCGQESKDSAEIF